MDGFDREWSEQITEWVREIHFAVKSVQKSVSKIEDRLESLSKIASRFEIYEKMVIWAVPLLLTSSFVIAWQALELKSTVNRHNEKISEVDRSMENLSWSIFDLQRSIDRLSDLPKRVERVESRLMEPEKKVK